MTVLVPSRCMPTVMVPIELLSSHVPAGTCLAGASLQGLGCCTGRSRVAKYPVKDMTCCAVINSTRSQGDDVQRDPRP